MLLPNSYRHPNLNKGFEDYSGVFLWVFSDSLEQKDRPLSPSCSIYLRNQIMPAPKGGFGVQTNSRKQRVVGQTELRCALLGDDPQTFWGEDYSRVGEFRGPRARGWSARESPRGQNLDFTPLQTGPVRGLKHGGKLGNEPTDWKVSHPLSCRLGNWSHRCIIDSEDVVL